MKKLLIVLLALGSLSTFACQYGYISTEDYNSVVLKTYPNAANIESLSSEHISSGIFGLSTNDMKCPSIYRIDSEVEFDLGELRCSGLMIQRHRSGEFKRGRLKSVECQQI